MVTPLTDRCYITLTQVSLSPFSFSLSLARAPPPPPSQSLPRSYTHTPTQAMRLILGGAPAGPAGTGKTETTKVETLIPQP